MRRIGGRQHGRRSGPLGRPSGAARVAAAASAIAARESAARERARFAAVLPVLNTSWYELPPSPPEFLTSYSCFWPRGPFFSSSDQHNRGVTCAGPCWRFSPASQPFISVSPRSVRVIPASSPTNPRFSPFRKKSSKRGETDRNGPNVMVVLIYMYIHSLILICMLRYLCIWYNSTNSSFSCYTFMY